ncbi:transporter substrate-binding domain-containing protein [Dasania sp. GY-MA-18]|uniref:Transporter substrate-binding domain-containing protein n=1 Tax=Dasania phycosphaerae TaxID=2950436 RepID=A0A9J6RJU8_9GAMM|nr:MULTISPECIES: transporter substrate-binding domain-containing protein [Dasania]MCR8922076.1 transporter substrate-binding domain-containing protein [Dasania sp. GY-MA-18]MCZ0864504.1 transporter substrate-binding domain-containing protein [Dasania phycosphaerae]MCZ0868232.1 transporter substrate-binding domain-containing protein [Dasania phycosphaerae]
MGIKARLTNILRAGLVCCSTMAAADTLVVATDIWEDFSNADGSGYYTDILSAIYEPRGIKVEVKYVPYKRSVEMMTSGKADVVLGAYKSEGLAGSYAAYPLEMDVVDVAISPELAASWSGLATLEGKKVGAVRGNDFDEYVPVKIQYKEVSNLKSLVKMLNHKRIDAILDYEADILRELKATGETAKFEIKNGVIKTPSFAVFANNSHGQAMLKIFNEAFIELHQSGQLKELLMKNTGSLDGYPVLE